MSEAPLSFGPFRLDPAAGRLSRGGRPLQAGQRGLALLAALAEARGRVVAKDALMERAWPGLAVEEANLTVQIAALRKLMGPRPDGGDWIVTVPRQGYRLDTGGPDEEAEALRPRLAVLPFEDLNGGGAAAGRLAAGITEEVLTALGRYRAFDVVPWHAAPAEHEPADPLSRARGAHARYLLCGSLRQTPDRLRVTARLIDAESGAQLWAGTQDGDPGDVLALQEWIGAAVAVEVVPRIEAAEIRKAARSGAVVGSGSLAAHGLFLRALAMIHAETEPANAEAHALLAEALRIEPENPAALACAAWVLEHRTTVGWPPFGPDDRARCVDLAARALAAGTQDARLMAICGVALMQTGREYDWGLAVLRQALAANPADIHARTACAVGEVHCGDLAEARAHFESVIAQAPGDPVLHIACSGLAHLEIIQGRPGVALPLAARALALNAGFDPVHWMLVAANVQLGRMDEARRRLAQYRALSPGATVARIRAGQPGQRPERIEPVLEALARAGLPEG